jgi:hypothetical protein
VHPKIATGKVQVAYFENVFSDWSIFKEVVLLSNQRFPNNSLSFLFYVYPTLFSLSQHFVCFEIYSSSGESHRWIKGSLQHYLGEPHIIIFCDDY